MPAQPLPLAAEFPAADREAWRALVAAVLAKTAGFDAADAADAEHAEDALAVTTYDGIRVGPLYTAADTHGVEDDGVPGRPPFVRAATAAGATTAGWDVRVRHEGGDAGTANRAALTDLENGAGSLWLVLRSGGVRARDLAAVLDGVYLDLAPVVLDAGTDVLAASDAYFAVADGRGVARAELRGSLGADPVGLRARSGATADVAVLGELARRRDGAPQLHVATVDATVYHEAGASDAQELGIATAVGVAYLRALTDAGLSVDEALAAIEFRFAVTAEQFPSIAKLRAARRVWDRVAELCGAGEGRRGQWQHAVTSAAMLTRRDPWVNMLRATIGCFAAAVGGADAVTVLPFDSAIGVSDGFARRIARNTQSVLHDESSLGRVIDAAGGSWFVESLTDALAEKAWEIFTGVERAGGAVHALDGGLLGELIASVRERRLDDIAHRRAPITGVSEYAFVGEEPVERPPRPADDGSGGPLPAVRYAEAFEALRDAADAAPRRPTVFVAGLGPVAAHTARASFAASLFHAGGIETITADGDKDELVAAYRATGTTVACVCSSDKHYATEGADVVAALRDAGATQIWLAGRADAAGADGQLYTGCDALAVLRSVHAALGVAG